MSSELQRYTHTIDTMGSHTGHPMCWGSVTGKWVLYSGAQKLQARIDELEEILGLTKEYGCNFTDLSMVIQIKENNELQARINELEEQYKCAIDTATQKAVEFAEVHSALYVEQNLWKKKIEKETQKKNQLLYEKNEQLQADLVQAKDRLQTGWESVYYQCDTPEDKADVVKWLKETKDWLTKTTRNE